MHSRLLTLEALLEVGLNILRVPGLPQDLQEVITRQEVEPREDHPLGLEVGIQGLLDALQAGIHALELGVEGGGQHKERR